MRFSLKKWFRVTCIWCFYVVGLCFIKHFVSDEFDNSVAKHGKWHYWIRITALVHHIALPKQFAQQHTISALPSCVTLKTFSFAASAVANDDVGMK